MKIKGTNDFLDTLTRNSREVTSTNSTATSDPTVTDDVDLGYSVGDRWINAASKAEWVCIDNTSSAAIWKFVTSSINYSDRVGCLLTKASSFSHTATTFEIIPLDTATYNYGNCHDVTNDRFKAPVAGKYRINVGIRHTDAGVDKRATVGIKVTGAASTDEQRSDYSWSPLSTAEIACRVNCVVDLVAGDYIELESWQENSATQVVDNIFLQVELETPSVVLAPNGITHAFSVSKTTEGADQDIDTAVETLVTWSDVVKETNVSFDLTNNKFVVPSNGWWHFDCTLHFVGAAAVDDTVYAALYIDGTKSERSFINRSHGTSQYVGVTYNHSLYLLAGQEIQIYAYGTNATARVRYLSHSTYFSGHKVSGTSTGVEYDRYDIAFRALVETQYTPGATASEELVLVDTIDFDNGGNFDTVNSKFIAPVTGLYDFSATLHVIGMPDNNRILLKLKVTGSNVRISDHFVSTPTTSNILPSNSWTTVSLLAGEEVTLYKQFANTATAYDIGVSTEFAGRLIQAITKAESSFSANLNGVDDTTSIIAAVATKIPLSNTDYNYGNGFDAVTNNRFTAPEKGRYFFSFSVGIPTLTSTTTDFVALLYKNGSLVKTGNRNAVRASGNHTSGGSDILELLKDDYIELWVYQSESTSETIKGAADQTWLTGYRLATVPTGDHYDPVVYEIEIATATDTIIVPAHLLGDTEYRFKFAAVNDNVTSSAYRIEINNDSTAANYDRVFHYTSTTTITTVDSDTNNFGAASQNETRVNAGDLVAMGGTLHVNFKGTRVTSGATQNEWGSITNDSTTFDTIDNITFKSDQTTGFGVGTRLKILKD